MTLFTDADVEAAARALMNTWKPRSWDTADHKSKEIYRRLAEQALTAAEANMVKDGRKESVASGFSSEFWLTGPIHIIRSK